MAIVFIGNLHASKCLLHLPMRFLTNTESRTTATIKMVAVASISYAEFVVSSILYTQKQTPNPNWKKTKSLVHKERLRIMIAKQYYDIPLLR